MRNKWVWRILVWVMSFILVGAAVFGLLLGNVRFRLLTADLYQKTLLESDVYTRSAVVILNQSGGDSDFVASLTAKQMQTVATTIVPLSYLDEMVSSAVDQTFDYLNQPDASSELMVSAEPLRIYWEQLDTIATCTSNSLLLPPNITALCQRDLPDILVTIQTEYAPEIRENLDEQLRPPTGTVYELVQHSGVTAVRFMQLALAGVGIITIASFTLKRTRQFWEWLWKMMLGGGLLVALAAFAIRIATAGFNDNIITEQQLTDNELALIVTDFLGSVGNRFVNGLFIQAALFILIGAMIWFAVRNSSKHKQLI